MFLRAAFCSTEREGGLLAVLLFLCELSFSNNVFVSACGLLWSLVEVTPHTAIAIRIAVFCLLQIGSFVVLSRFVSPVSCTKPTPVYRGVVEHYKSSSGNGISLEGFDIYLYISTAVVSR